MAHTLRMTHIYALERLLQPNLQTNSGKSSIFFLNLASIGYHFNGKNVYNSKTEILKKSLHMTDR